MIRLGSFKNRHEGSLYRIIVILVFIVTEEMIFNYTTKLSSRKVEIIITSKKKTNFNFHIIQINTRNLLQFNQ